MGLLGAESSAPMTRIMWGHMHAPAAANLGADIKVLSVVGILSSSYLESCAIQALFSPASSGTAGLIARIRNTFHGQRTCG